MVAAPAVFAEIAKVRAGTAASPWKNITRTAFADGLEERIRNPQAIDTSHLNLCGPGALFRNVAEDDPMLYVKFAREMYESGKSEIRGHKIEAPAALLNIQPSGNNNVTDMVTLMSWQNSENAIAGFTAEDTGFGGITLPGKLADWFKSFGYSGVVNSTNIYFTKDIDHLMIASDYFTHGYKVCLFICAKMLYANSIISSSFCPDHWITLESRITTTMRSKVKFVEFDGWCWGRRRRIPETGFVSGVNLTNNYYGFVAARP